MRVELDDGTLLEGDGADIDQAQLRLSYADASDKFLQVSRGALDDNSARKLVDEIAALEEPDSVDRVSRLMSRTHT